MKKLKLLLALFTVVLLTSCGREVSIKVVDIHENYATFELTYSGLEDPTYGDLIIKDTYGYMVNQDVTLYLGHGSDTVTVYGLLPGSRNYVGFITADDKYKSPVVEFDTPASPADGVDLGLSVKWAPTNIGADHPLKAGNYYAWGETTPKDRYNDYDYSYRKRIHQTTDKPESFSLAPENDAATKNLGDGWRMPTNNEVKELLENCEWHFIKNKHTVPPVDSFSYYVVVGPNGNSIIIPFCGYYNGSVRSGGFHMGGGRSMYWTSDNYPMDASQHGISRLRYYLYDDASVLYFSPEKQLSSHHLRSDGLPIRAVRSK